MITVELCSYIDGEQYDLIDHFIDHYSFLGVTSFRFCIDIKKSDEINSKVIKIINKHNKNNIKFDFTSKPFSSSLQMKFINKCLKQSESEWVLFVDLDEFISLDNSILGFKCKDIQALLGEADRNDMTYIRGVILDRVSKDLMLPEINNSQSIQEQFPLYANVSYDLSGNSPLTNKVFFTKTKLGFSYTGCRLAKPKDKNHYKTKEELVLIFDHFKWHSFFLKIHENKCYSLKRDQKGVKSDLWHKSMKFLFKIKNNTPFLRGVKTYEEFSLDIVPPQYKKNGRIKMF